MHRERDPQISGIHFISTLMRLMRIFICDSLVIFKVLQLLSNSNINNLFCNLDLDFWFGIRSVSLALSNRRRLKKKGLFCVKNRTATSILLKYSKVRFVYKHN